MKNWILIFSVMVMYLKFEIATDEVCLHPEIMFKPELIMSDLMAGMHHQCMWQF